MEIKNFLLSITLFLTLFLTYMFIPIYEKEDKSLKNVVNQKYWHDGISPLMFVYFKNYLKNRTLLLPENTVVDENFNLTVTKYVDVVCVEGFCYPIFSNYGLKLFFEFSYFLANFFSLSPYFYLLIVNIIAYSLSLVLLFNTLNLVNKNKEIVNFLVSLLVGLGTSFSIYSRYLFLHNSFQTLWFSAFLFFYLLFDEKRTNLRFLFLLLSSILFVISFQALPAVVMSFLLLVWFLFFEYKEKKFSIVFTLAMLIVFLLNLIVFINHLANLSSIGKKIIDEKNIFYNVYPSTHFAVDFVPLSILYSIENNSGNAIFLKFYPLFAYFFGQKGVFTNSPFLLFSFFGLTKVKRKLRVKLVLLLLLLAFFYVYINPDYEGGYTPRYVRHAEPFILIFSIFLVKYLSKEKSKLFILVFVTFSAISITNCFSLSIRTDWNYVKITDLISSDIIVWPWLSIKQENITLDLTKVSEQAKWNLTWEEGCNPPVTEPRFSSQGLELGPCGCAFKNYASRSIKIPLSMRYLEIEVCSKLSGGDGIIFLVTIDNKNYSYYIESSKCEQIYINITEFADNRFHVIQLSSERNGVCDFEVLLVKKVTLIKEINIVDELNLIKKQWKWGVYSPCKLYWLNNSIVTEKCYCSQSSYASTIVDVERRFPYLNLEVCADKGGGDGVLAEIIIDNKVYSFLVPSNSCINRSIFIDTEKEKINLTLTSEIYGYCSEERIFWRKITFEAEPRGRLIEEKNIYDLRSREEQSRWTLNFLEICKPPITEPRFSELGIETGPCACTFVNNATRKMIIPKDVNALKIEVCSKFSGGDGTLAYIYLDKKEVVKSKLEANTCKNIIVDVSQFADGKEHILTLESRRYKNCFEEVAVWKKIELIRWNNSFPVYEFDLSSEIDKWNSNNKVCPADVRYDGIITDFCWCSSPAQASYYWNVEKDKNLKLKIKACAFFAGGDGVIGEIYIDNDLFKQIFIKSNDCVTIEENINLKKGVHIITLQPKIYGNCFAEFVKWAEVVVE